MCKTPSVNKKKRLKYRLGVLAAVFLVTASVNAHAANSCAEILASTKARVVSYWGDVVDTKGARLFVKPGDVATTDYGFFEFEKVDVGVARWRSWLTLSPISYWLGARLTGRADTRLALGNGIWSGLIDRPTHLLTRQFAGPHTRPTFLAKLPLLVAWVFLAETYVIAPVTDFAFNSKIQSEITRHQSAFDDLIQNDYRFHSIKDQLRNGDIDTKEAEREAYLISQAYAKYYEFRDGKAGRFSHADNMNLLNHYLFMHLKGVMTGEVTVPPGFTTTAAFTKTLTDARRDQLFQQTHALYMKYQLVQVYAASLGGNATPVPDWLQPYLAEMRRDPFVHRVTALLGRGKISAPRFSSLLMENYFWAYRIACWELVGLVKLNPATGKPVVLGDYQGEILGAEVGGDGAKLSGD